MKVYTGFDSFPKLSKAVVTTGTFDGVHLGHKKILDEFVNIGMNNNAETVLVTFFPHPRIVLFPDHELKLINTIDENINLLKNYNINHVIIQKFDKNFSRITSLDYVRDILLTKVGLQNLVIGFNHHFGRNREGAFKHLMKYGPIYGFEVEEKSIPMTRVDDAVRRILKVKFELSLFDYPKADFSLIDKIGSKEHRLLAREAVRKSLVLLKNQNNILPLSESYSRIHVAGKGADDIGIQCGGWSIEWQGKEGNITPGTTIFQGILEHIYQNKKNIQLTYSSDGTGASGADVAVLVLSEKPYAEWFGDDNQLQLSEENKNILSNLKKENIPIVTILISGRPLIINDELNNSDAYIAAWLPGTEGAGVSDILFGEYSPTGKLSYTWPKNIDQVPININDFREPLFPFGFGSTY